jgi:hypothetical protein
MVSGNMQRYEVLCMLPQGFKSDRVLKHNDRHAQKKTHHFGVLLLPDNGNGATPDQGREKYEEVGLNGVLGFKARRRPGRDERRWKG